MRKLIEQAFAPAVNNSQPVFKDQRRYQYQMARDNKGRLAVVGVELVENYRRLQSRGKSGKTAHKPTGIAKVRRAARKARRVK
ncbi:hypothetical protein PEC302107_35940 [Pectobacterium araliae]|uniref:hypothetical protein n=1 Tax=Pectobacterium araliae TaxID=3073862 RepID=UPI00208891CD|nr:hypothetical protein PEC302107_35940 [Pectobacterium carotovorum subsp. carotovorum]